MRAVRRLLWREALFLWIRPLPALESSDEEADFSAASAAALLPPSISFRTFLTDVRICERWLTLCWLRFTAWRARFFADLMLAKGVTPEIGMGRKRGVSIRIRGGFVKSPPIRTAG